MQNIYQDTYEKVPLFTEMIAREELSKTLSENILNVRFNFISLRIKNIKKTFPLTQRRNKNILNSHETEHIDINGNVAKESKKNDKSEKEYRIQLAWINICGFMYLHYAAIIGLFQIRIDFLLVFGEY